MIFKNQGFSDVSSTYTHTLNVEGAMGCLRTLTGDMYALVSSQLIFFNIADVVVVIIW